MHTPNPHLIETNFVFKLLWLFPVYVGPRRVLGVYSTICSWPDSCTLMPSPNMYGSSSPPPPPTRRRISMRPRIPWARAVRDEAAAAGSSISHLQHKAYSDEGRPTYVRSGFRSTNRIPSDPLNRIQPATHPVPSQPAIHPSFPFNFVCAGGWSVSLSLSV